MSNEEKTLADVAAEAYAASWAGATSSLTWHKVQKAVIEEWQRRNGEPAFFRDPDIGDTCGSQSEVYCQACYLTPQPAKLPSVEEIKRAIRSACSVEDADEQAQAVLESLKGKKS